MAASWISEILDRVTASRKFAIALFLATLVLLVGPHISEMQEVPNSYRWVVQGLCLFSGILLCVSLLEVLWTGILLFTGMAKKTLGRSARLDAEESGLLLFLGKEHAGESIDLSELRSADGLSQLDLLAIRDSLAKKEFIDVNSYDSKLISLSAKGREYVRETISRNRPKR